MEKKLQMQDWVVENRIREVVQRAIKGVKRNEWKRLQFAPQLKVSPMSFGLDRRWPVS